MSEAGWLTIAGYALTVTIGVSTFALTVIGWFLVRMLKGTERQIERLETKDEDRQERLAAIEAVLKIFPKRRSVPGPWPSPTPKEGSAG